MNFRNILRGSLGGKSHCSQDSYLHTRPTDNLQYNIITALQSWALSNCSEKSGLNTEILPRKGYLGYFRGGEGGGGGI